MKVGKYASCFQSPWRDSVPIFDEFMWQALSPVSYIPGDGFLILQLCVQAAHWKTLRVSQCWPLSSDISKAKGYF